MSWKRAFFILLTVMIGSNLAWAYVMVDSGVTSTHTAAEHQYALRDLAVMKRVLPESRPLSRADVLALLRRTHPDALIVDDSTGVSMGGLRFEFDGDRLARVGEYGR